MENRDHEHLAHAIEQARIGRDEGGVPIGGALIADDGTILGVGHNRRVQEGSAIRHGETDALENAGRLPAAGLPAARRCTRRSRPATCAPAPSCSTASRASSSARTARSSAARTTFALAASR